MKLNKKNGGQILAESLHNFGINTIFMVPGESYLAAIDGLYDYKNKIKLITCRHESGAANMAEAYGKISKLRRSTYCNARFYSNDFIHRSDYKKK